MSVMGKGKSSEKRRGEINEKIYDFRRNAHLTQQQLADLLGMNVTTYSPMERNGQIKVDKLIQIAKVLGKSPTDFFTGEAQSMNQPEPVIANEEEIDFIMTHNDRMIVKMYHFLPKEAKDNVMAFMTEQYHAARKRKKQN